jgi:hypothetical protein
MKAAIYLEMTPSLRDEILEQAKKEHLHPNSFIRKVLKNYLYEKKSTELYNRNRSIRDLEDLRK